MIAFLISSPLDEKTFAPHQAQHLADRWYPRPKMPTSGRGNAPSPASTCGLALHNPADRSVFAARPASLSAPQADTRLPSQRAF
jgi:hypothetical protein